VTEQKPLFAEIRLVLPPLNGVELVAVRAAEVLGRGAGFPRETLDAVGIALAEACLNGLEHGRGEGGIMVRLALEEGVRRAPALLVEVEDHGIGFGKSRSRHPGRVGGRLKKRGWGLVLMRELMDEVDVESVPGRTVVRMRKYLEDRG